MQFQAGVASVENQTWAMDEDAGLNLAAMTELSKRAWEGRYEWLREEGKRFYSRGIYSW